MPLGSITKRFRRTRSAAKGEGSVSGELSKHEVLPQLLYSAQDEASESTREEHHAHQDEPSAPPPMPIPMLVMPDAPDIVIDVEVTQPIPAQERSESAPLPEEPLEELSRLGQEIDRHYGSESFPWTFH